MLYKKYEELIMEKKTMEAIHSFMEKRNWKSFHTGENLAKSIVIEAAELLENFQWSIQEKDVNNVKEELADILIYAILLADEYGFNLDEIILEKLAKNEQKYPVEKAYGNAKKYNEF